MVPKRIELVPASGLPSSYKKKYKPKERWDISVFKEGANISPDMFEALKKLEELVRLNKGTLYVTDLFRSWATQAEARKKFETGKKRAFVAKPGGSFHNAGRAIDIAIKELNFEGCDRDDWLALLWSLAKPLGFKPIIRMPEMDASEAWHFDFPGKDWSAAYKTMHYSEVAKCCILDVGEWNPDESDEKIRKMFIQSQLIRLGFYEIGKVDGVFGPKTNKVLEFCGVKDFDTQTMASVLSKRDPQRL